MGQEFTSRLFERIQPFLSRQDGVPGIAEKFKCRFGQQALNKLLAEYDFHTVLDVGSGGGEHSRAFLHCSKQVTAVDFGRSYYFNKKTDDYRYLQGDFLSISFEEPFDCVWACHVLEHQPNVGQFLRHVHLNLRENGILALTVPPAKHKIVGGHLTIWNAGLLLYNLVIAGFDCKKAKVKKYGYDISVLLEKKSIQELPPLDYDKGDIEALAEFFPDGFGEPFSGNFRYLNWD